ncbi:MAG: hypothetical protein QM490_02535, partial [Candidatus Gracilibacteria bacterium]
MGLYKKRGYLTNSLKVLVDMRRPLLAKHDFNPINGKLESFYYLTKHGKKFLIEELEYNENQIKAPKGLTTIYLKDYFHRKLTIDFHIHFNQWIESNNGKINFLNYYFDKTGNNRGTDSINYVTALNRVHIDEKNSFIPDINTIFSINDKKYLYLFEQHNGQDTKRLFEQLYIHILAISKGVVSEKYNIKKPHIVVVVCEHESVKKSVIQRLQKEKGIEHYNNFFIFKTNSELEQDFYNNWTLISGKQATFLNNLEANLS